MLFSTLLLLAPAAQAQLEVLLRGVQPTEPRQGACGLYRFRADEPSGQRLLEFHACIESVGQGESGAIVLRLWSGDSLEARIEVSPRLFEAQGGSLAENILRVVQVEHGDRREITPEEWQKLPALSPAPELPVVADSSLGKVRHARTGLECDGRRLEEARESRRQMGEAEMVLSESRELQILTAPQAPILGVVRATALVRSERRFSQPIPGVPQHGPRESRYELELLALGAGLESSPE